MSIDKRIEELGLVLPQPQKAIGAYKTVMTVGDMVYLSGHLPIGSDGNLMTGCAKTEADIEEGYLQAKRCGLAMLASLKEHLGTLDRVGQVVKTLGMVAAAPDFTAHPKIINGCSELFAEVFGSEKGVGVRSAFGVSSLPLGVMVEIEAVFQIDPA